MEHGHSIRNIYKSGATKTYHGDGEWCRLVRMYGHGYRYAYMSLPMQYAGY